MPKNASGITYPFEVISHTVTGKSSMRLMLTLLLERSAWFSVMPLPGDQYRVTMKEENEKFLLDAMDVLHVEKSKLPFKLEDVRQVMRGVDSEVVQDVYLGLLSVRKYRQQICDAAKGATDAQEASRRMQTEIRQIGTELDWRLP